MIEIRLYLRVFFIFVLPSLQQNGISIFKSTDPNCLSFHGTECVSCSYLYFMASPGKCTPVHPFCKQYNQYNGQCTRCYPHYKLKSGFCIKIFQRLSPRCKILNIKLRVCRQCLKEYVLNAQTGICQQLDPNCQKFMPDNSCKKCKDRFYLNLKELKCKQVNINCKQYNSQNGTCTSCINDMKLRIGTCLFFNIDKNCQNYDTQNQCIKCIKNFQLNEGLCVQSNEQYKNYCIDRFYYNSTSEICIRVSNQCLIYHKTNGSCVFCQNNYQIKEGFCIQYGTSNLFANIIDQNKDTASFSQNDQCPGIDFFESGMCRSIDMNCLNFNYQTLNCLNCINPKRPSSFNCID